MVDMTKRIYDSGSLQGFNVVTHLYPTSEGSKGFCGGGSMDHVCMSYNDGEIVDRVITEWRVLMGSMQDME